MLRGHLVWHRLLTMLYRGYPAMSSHPRPAVGVCSAACSAVCAGAVATGLSSGGFYRQVGL